MPRRRRGRTIARRQLDEVRQDSRDGLVYSVDGELRGSDNVDGIACFLDALLFSLYARHDLFDAMLFGLGEDAAGRLALALRLWVNMLRAGLLIEEGITRPLLQRIAECGWRDVHDGQQDASEAFLFITQALAMPYFTLTVDLAHSGKEDALDDHKVVNERLLYVSIGAPDGPPISLQACLEEFFASQVDVVRGLERRATIDSSKGNSTHHETGNWQEGNTQIPAWQFFRLLPFYTCMDPSLPAASLDRPVLGVCLKRFAMDAEGCMIKNARRVIVADRILFPPFIARDSEGTESQQGSELNLLSAVCHRGDSLHSGHYISLVRDPNTGSWLRFDDLATPKVVPVDGKKAFSQEDPYLLFYELVHEASGRGSVEIYKRHTWKHRDPNKHRRDCMVM